jgi:hypothetical protein
VGIRNPEIAETSHYSVSRWVMKNVFGGLRMFVHTVYFWVKADAPAGAADQLAGDCRELLGQIPGLRHIWAGKPVPSDRPVVDGSYAVGLTTVFDDKAGHDAYQTHPLHLQFIERNKANWSRVQVYDFV